MAAHTPVLRNTTVRSIPSAMPVKSVRNRLPEDFFSGRRGVCFTQEGRIAGEGGKVSQTGMACEAVRLPLPPESLVCQQPCTPFRSVAYTGDDERIVLFFGSDRGPSAAGGVGRTRGKMVEVFKRDRQPGPVRRQGFGRNQQGS